ncbi:hypothetical protein H181DRAFT_02006 [Streptomyces sp. WMMB 714]|uniref:hypothetical protein n=1 Tax=Streptomyces sp. WMMB 714 TaxID=1286822 RepID=UPI000696FBCA|nr:hypothetical protein [Streptomyces sp. WMMB 714]SCK25754.1 hypothetical protein H181DRAFT_02006 [Streptomyces sp. WMMB 714]
MTSQYRIPVRDLRSDRLLDVLPLTEVSVEDCIGKAGTFDTYLEHRTLRTTRTAKGVDQLGIARDLVDYAQAQPGGDIGITYDTGTLRPRSCSPPTLTTDVDEKIVSETLGHSSTWFTRDTYESVMPKVAAAAAEATAALVPRGPSRAPQPVPHEEGRPHR